jgi:hypothetical protein
MKFTFQKKNYFPENKHILKNSTIHKHPDKIVKSRKNAQYGFGFVEETPELKRLTLTEALENRMIKQGT